MACIALIGYRACGKTTIGQRVAAQLGLRFVDLDSVIETRLGEPISRFFATHGEAAFRQIEQEQLRLVLENPHDLVLSTGGGCVLREENRCILREKTTIVIYINVAAEILQQRLTLNDGGRPSLTGSRVADEVPRILSQREPLYRAVAQQVVDGNGPLTDVTAAIVTIVENLD